MSEDTMVEVKKNQNMKKVTFVVLLLSFGLLACGGDKTPSTAESQTAEEVKGPNTLQSIEIHSEPLGTVISFVGTKEMSPNIFKLEDPDRIVLDLTDTKLGDVKSEFNVGDSTVSRISLQQFDDGGSSLSRAEIALNIPADYQMDSLNNRLVITVGDVDNPLAIAQPSESAAEVATGDASGADVAAPSFDDSSFEDLGQVFSVEEDQTGDPFALSGESAAPITAPTEPVLSTPASSLVAVDYATSEEGTVVMITGDGVFESIEEKTLASPNRLVFDFMNVQNVNVDQKNIALETPEVSQIRIGENDGYTRVVLDLQSDEVPDYTLSKNNDKATILVSRGFAAASQAPAPQATESFQEEATVPLDATASTTFEDSSTVNVDLGLDVVNRKKITVESVEFTQRTDIGKSRFSLGVNRDDVKFDVLRVSNKQIRLYIPNAKFKNTLLERYLDTSQYQSNVKRITPVYHESDKAVSFLIDMAIPDAHYDLVQNGTFIEIDFAIPAKEELAQTEIVAPTNFASESASSEQQDFEAAEVVGLEKVPSANKDAKNPTLLLKPQKNYRYVNESFMSDSMEGDEPLSQMGQILAGNIEGKRFSGRKISLDIKDADIRAIFRLIADISKFNLIISDEVDGRVTIKLDDVPWDQAFAIILQSKGLWFEKYGSIVRIAPAQKLQQEKEQAAAAQAAAQAVKPLDILFKPVSYAEASTLTSQISSVLSERGSVDIDSRTNTLIIKDIRENLDKAKKMVDILDTQTPQVSIEARIVEATDTFGRSLGINWSGNARFTAASGNPTGLWFPSNVNIPFALDFGSVQTGVHTAGVQLGSINNILDLDLALAFGEQQGESKLISAPKVTVLDNKSASISAGSRIPFVTQTADSGSNVRFENAATTLSVTPHITNEGAILMQITATRNEPNFADLVQGNPSIDQRTATTEVLVKSGNTTVLGGIYAIRTGRTKVKIPFISSLPIIGAIFQNYDKSLDRTELLIFVTPRIVGDEREAIRDVRQ
ncbi:MAG: type IV pilus secretin PilQ [Bdellovibrionales bacterium]|nr:type IV pilus secretin PilQ [Bdellovibrionales bacterium]